MFHLSNLTRSAGDPKIVKSGPSSLGVADRLARGLGWFSIALGAAELIAPRRLTRALGMEGSETLVRVYGLREIMAGMMTLSTEKNVGLASRVAGDGLDIATLFAAMRPGNPKRDNVGLALAMVVGVTILDIAAAKASAARHARAAPSSPDRYRNRSGFPKGLQQARGAARDFKTPRDMRAAPALAEAGGV
ncbi:hypothetical protein [Alsobacter sp. SYSU BS001988]|jgi:hypothetical protein